MAKPDNEQTKQAADWQKQIDEIVSGKGPETPPKNLKEFIDQATARQAAAKKKRAPKKRA